MKALSLLTKIFLAAIYTAGCGLFIWNIRFASTSNFWMVIVLSMLASFFQIFKVVGATDRSHYTFSFLVYGFAFAHFGLGETLVVILISNFVDWVWNRPAWYIQIFNTTSYFIVMSAAYLASRLTNPSGSLLIPLGVLSVAISMVVFTLLNHIILGIVLWLARGENFKVSRMLDFFPFVMDLTLLTFGSMLNLVWNTSPYAMVLFLFPLYLIYTTLRIPALERQIEIDAKTGLFNHQYFMRQLSSELDRANRFDRPLTVIMIDLDLLRNINNTYGHLAGDEILIGIARVLKQSVREYDVVARFGGEEFAILLPEATVKQSYERAEIIRRAIELADFSVPTSVTPIKATISLGLAERESFTQTSEEIIHNADTALYHSKLSGRNQSYAYTNEAYLGFLENAQKAELHADARMNDALQKESGNGNIPEYPASETKYIKAEEGSQAGDGSARKESSPTMLTSKPTSHFKPVYAYIAGLALLATLFGYGLYLISPELYQFNWMQIGPGLLTCMVVLALTEAYSIDLYLGKTSLSTSAVPLLAGTLLFGPTAGIILSATYAIVVGIKYRSKFNKYIFNFSNQVIPAMIYILALHLSGKLLTDLPIATQAIVVVAAAMIVYIMNTWLISFGMGIDLHQSPKQIWKQQYAWLATIYAGIGLIATAFIFAYRVEGVLGALLMMVPLLLLRISQKQYVDRTREAVTELREKNIILERNSEEISQLNDGLLNTLAEIIDLRDPYVLGHSRRVTHYATMISRHLGLNYKQVELVRKGSLLHDVGKLGIPMEILAKPGPLTPQEYEQVKRHPVAGARVLEMNPSLRLLIPIVRHHHEFFDGRGYPDGISGHQIPIEARIVSVADAVEAMASDRPYRKARSAQVIIDELNKCSGTQFDPQIVDQAVLLLENEEIGRSSRLSPQPVFALRTN